MFHFLFGLFVILHGLVHMWYVALSQAWVPFDPNMGWTGRSWLFTGMIGDAATRNLATAVLALATVGFVIGGAAFWARADWWRVIVIGSAGFSTLVLLLFWDGDPAMIVQKGIIGVLINVGLIVGLLLTA